MHNGWLPREGFKADTVLRLLWSTALNPALILPLVLLARFTKKGQNLSILHPLAFSRLKTLLCLGTFRLLSNYLSDRVINNWVDDKYDWNKEIVLVTGGAGGIGGQVVQLLAERGIKVVVLDIQPLSYEAVLWRKVVQDVDRFYEEKETAKTAGHDAEASTVLISKADGE